MFYVLIDDDDDDVDVSRASPISSQNIIVSYYLSIIWSLNRHLKKIVEENNRLM